MDVIFYPRKGLKRKYRSPPAGARGARNWSGKPGFRPPGRKCAHNREEEVLYAFILGECGAGYMFVKADT
jgi:hypothetical protein